MAKEYMARNKCKNCSWQGWEPIKQGTTVKEYLDGRICDTCNCLMIPEKPKSEDE